MCVILINPPLFQTEDPQLLQRFKNTDSVRMPIGLFVLAAVLREEGFAVRLLNQVLLPFTRAVEEAADQSATLVGITCLSHNRTATMALAESLKTRLPRTPVILGGGHATLLHQEILEHYPAVDFVAVGESERSVPALLRALAAGRSVHDLPGIASRRSDGSPVWPGPAEPISDLGTLPVPAKYYSYDIVSTSRGCPFRCSFCSSRTLWGSQVRYRPVEHVIEEVILMHRQHGVQAFCFKDETFTANKKRVIEICKAIIQLRLPVWWSCDTRVDCLDEERLYWMRKSGCYLISFGVESGSPEMLNAINKRTSLDDVRRATRLARCFGIKVRFYLIAGLPNEKTKDLQASLRLVQESKPHYVLLSNLTVNPGTEVFRQYCETHGYNDSLWFKVSDPVIYFDHALPYRNTRAGQSLLQMDVGGNGAQAGSLYPFTEEELREAQQRVPDAFSPNYDLAVFLLEKARFAGAEAFYRIARSIRPDQGAPMLGLGLCLYKLGRSEEAVALWKRVESLPGEHENNRLLGLIYRGEAAMDQQQPEAAMALWRQAHKRKPDAVEPLRRLALHRRVFS